MKFLVAGVSVVMLLVCGCETVTVPPSSKGTRILPPGEEIVGDPTVMTIQNLETVVQKLMEKMLGSPRFTEAYAAAKKAKKGKLPIVFVGNIENLSQDVSVKVRLNAMRDTVLTSLYDTGLVDVTDDEAREEIDFIVLGDMRPFADVGGYHTYRLHLFIQSLTTDKIVWEGVQTMVKL